MVVLASAGGGGGDASAATDVFAPLLSSLKYPVVFRVGDAARGVEADVAVPDGVRKTAPFPPSVLALRDASGVGGGRASTTDEDAA
jgi:hypothetical protein